MLSINYDYCTTPLIIHQQAERVVFYNNLLITVYFVRFAFRVINLKNHLSKLIQMIKLYIISDF